MRTFSGKRSTLALAIAAVTAMSGWVWLHRPAQQAYR
ncbi:N-acetylglucosamine-regulated outer membrane porin [Klebsiella pneumoniae]|uniref:N-acetylglucosamine-regulated outer membrane porin n=1 Tax=Klebsiella pneumoniae TaxID=573 RepID=A0A4P0XYW1_KLEPN|nr:N-acetylglucosamine-regulated outer membrane porin [Klebsiella pneumoniae]